MPDRGASPGAYATPGSAIAKPIEPGPRARPEFRINLVAKVIAPVSGYALAEKRSTIFFPGVAATAQLYERGLCLAVPQNVFGSLNAQELEDARQSALSIRHQILKPDLSSAFHISVGKLLRLGEFRGPDIRNAPGIDF